MTHRQRSIPAVQNIFPGFIATILASRTTSFVLKVLGPLLSQPGNKYQNQTSADPMSATGDCRVYQHFIYGPSRTTRAAQGVNSTERFLVRDVRLNTQYSTFEDGNHRYDQYSFWIEGGDPRYRRFDE